MRRFRIGLAIVPVVLAVLGTTLVVAAPRQSRGRHGELMRRKLEYSQKLLAGIALEDFPTIAKSARDLKALSEDAEWNAFPDLDYLRYSTEFRSITDEIAQRAGEKNLDGATLGYVQLTLNCVRCHKFVRVLRK